MAKSHSKRLRFVERVLHSKQVHLITFVLFELGKREHVRNAGAQKLALTFCVAEMPFDSPSLYLHLHTDMGAKQALNTNTIFLSNGNAIASPSNAKQTDLDVCAKQRTREIQRKSAGRLMRI